MNFQRFKQTRAISRHVSHNVSGTGYCPSTPFLRADLLPITLPLTAGRQKGLRATHPQVRVLSILSSALAFFGFISTHPRTTGAKLDEQQR